MKISMHECKLGWNKDLEASFTFRGFATFESDFYLPKLGKYGCSQLRGVWKTRNAGTTRISRNSFIFAIGVTCKHHHATDWEYSTVELTILLMISSAVAIKIVAHTQTGRIVSSGASTDTVSTSASTNLLVKVSHHCIYTFTIFVIQGRIR